MSAVKSSSAESGRAPGAGRDRFEWLLLAALAALAFSVIAGLFLRTLVKGGHVTGSDGYLVVDALQYLNWLRQAGVHIGAANLYDFAPLDHTFVHPGLILAGLVNRLGASPVVSYALVKPFAVAALFFGGAGLVHRHLSLRSDRRVALTLALFYCAPAAAVAGWVLAPSSEAKFQLDFAGGEVWVGSYLWGYSFTAVAVGLVPIGLIAWERGRAGGTRPMVAAACCALLASWFQPWQGATLIGVVVLAEAIRARGDRPQLRTMLRRLGPVVLAGAAPLAYYFVLSKVDPAWELAGVANNERPRWPLWVLLLTLGPLALPAAFAYGRTGWRDAGSAALRLWPLVGLAIYFAPVGTFPFHAIQGMQVPLAVLAVIAIRERIGQRRLPLAAGALAVLVLVVPGTLYRVDQMRGAVNAGQQAFFLTDDEHAALRWIERSTEPGGVVTENYLGTVIPAWTGRQTWIGAGSWTPQFEQRRKLVDALFGGRLDGDAARQMLVRPGAGLILEACRAQPGFWRAVQGFTEVIWQRGCVKVLKIEGVPQGFSDPAPPLPAIPPRGG